MRLAVLIIASLFTLNICAQEKMNKLSVNPIQLIGYNRLNVDFERGLNNLLTISASSAQTSIRIDKTQLDLIIKKLKDSLNIPGIAVGIAVNDEIKYINISGYANLETKTELTINSVWHICSLSKQFSTVACLKLAEENKLSLQDKISSYIDNLPEEYADITISELLSQTSGIKDYLNDKNLYGLPWENVKNQIFSDTLNFKPGAAWSYSNTGFWIVARIIEKVTGTDYNQYLSQNFFNKLKMDKTQRISGEKIIDSRVNGYVYKGGEFFNSVYDINKFYGKGDGDLMSALNDLLIWNISLTRGKIINEKSVSKLWTPSKLNNGKELEIATGSGISYGLGWFISDINKDKAVWTPGAGFGFSISSQYIPKYNLTIIVCCNKEQFLMANDIGFAIAKDILPLN
jgi:CubicO group peptidase (beta-lactamase class C family)